MSSRAVLRLFESFLLFTALRVMIFFCAWILLTCLGIDVSSTELLTTFPTPRLAATSAYKEVICTRWKPTSKDIITRIIFETPPLTPGTLFSVHLTWGEKGFWDFKQGTK